MYRISIDSRQLGFGIPVSYWEPNTLNPQKQWRNILRVSSIFFSLLAGKCGTLIYLKVGHDNLVIIYRLITYNYCLLRCTIFAIKNKSLSKVQGYYDPPRHVPTLLFYTVQSKACS